MAKVIAVDLEVNTQKAQKATNELTGSLDRLSGGAISGFKAMKTSLMTVVAGFKTLKGAIIATGIGALIVAITSLQAAFTSSEEGQNKWNKILTITGAIVGNFIDLLADLGEKLIWAFENPKQALNDFAELIKTNLINRFNGLLELLPALGKAVSLVFEGEFEQAGKVAVNAAAKVGLGVENITEKINEASDALKKFTNEQIKEAELAAKVADMRAKADKIERALLVERSELESQIAALRLKSRQEDEFTAEQRRQALLDAQDLEDKLLTKETEYLELRRDAQVLENTFSRSNKENLDKEAQAIAAVNRQTATRLNNARQVQRELNRLNGELEREQELLAKTKQDDAAKRLEVVVTEETKRTLAVNKVRLKAAEESNKIEEDRLNKQKEYDKQAAEQRIAIGLSAASTLFEIGKTEQKGTEEEQKKAFKRNKLLGIAQASIQTFQSAQGAYLSQLSIPTPDAPFRAAAAAAVATAAGLANIAKIKKQKFQMVSSDSSNPFSGGGSFGGSGNGSAGIGFNPSTPTISAIPTSSQIAAQGGQQSNVRAYVVQTDINNQTALDKRINQRSTL
jgi:hypothetical protein